MGLIECKECKKAMDAIDKRNMRLDKKRESKYRVCKGEGAQLSSTRQGRCQFHNRNE